MNTMKDIDIAIAKTKFNNALKSYKIIQDIFINSEIERKFNQMKRDLLYIINDIKRMDNGNITFKVYCDIYNICIEFCILDDLYNITIFANYKSYDSNATFSYSFNLNDIFYKIFPMYSDCRKGEFYQFVYEWENKRNYIIKCCYEQLTEYIKGLMDNISIKTE